MSAVLVLTVALLLAIIVSGYKYGAPEQMCRQPGALQRAHGGSTADIASMEYSIGVKKGVGGHFECEYLSFLLDFFFTLWICLTRQDQFLQRDSRTARWWGTELAIVRIWVRIPIITSSSCEEELITLMLAQNKN